MFIAQLRNNCHQLRALENTKGSLGRKDVYVLHLWKSGNKKKHFILECEAFKDNRDSYVSILTTSSSDNLFNEGTMKKLGALIIKLNKKRAEMQKSLCEGVCPISYC
jgi:hypothetical protein